MRDLVYFHTFFCAKLSHDLLASISGDDSKTSWELHDMVVPHYTSEWKMIDILSGYLIR